MSRWPKEVREAIGADSHELVTRGESGDAVYRIVRSEGRDSYLKVAAKDRRPELRHERGVLTWLQGRLGAPAVEVYSEQGTCAYLVTSAIPGRPAEELVSDGRKRFILVESARALREIHTFSVDSCPFEWRLPTLVAKAHRRAEGGKVDLEALDEERRDWSLRRLQEELDRRVPSVEDLVFTHGDLSLGNILFQRGRVTGLVDWGRAGIADRYRDIALLLRGFSASPGTSLREQFCDVYGIRDLDSDRVRFYQLLDEFL